MKKKNFFFINKGPFDLKKIIKIVNLNQKFSSKSLKLNDVRDLSSASYLDITFLNSSKYLELVKITKASACIINMNFKKFLPNNCFPIITENVLFTLAKITKLFYPDADVDKLDKTLVSSQKLKKRFKSVEFGKNVLIGKNVKIGKNSVIGNNSVVEHDVIIGENCLIGSNVVIKNSIIENFVYIQDGAVIGIKGFGFIPSKNKNFRIPHIGKVVLKEGVEIGASCTIDRGSISDTIIGKNTFLDNQVHIAHNVKIGKNCMIAGQVGIAGSSILGDQVVIGGQVGISGHLTIGNNVSIGGGSGVIKDVPDNSKIMGYPSVNLRDFVKKLEA